VRPRHARYDTDFNLFQTTITLEKQVQQRTAELEATLVARMGGDEFVVLIVPLAPELPVAEAQAMTVAEKIRAALALPYRLHLHGDDPASVVEHHCTSSIGVTLFDEHTLEDDALQRADEAMYRAKEEKGATGSVFRWLPMTESLFRAMADRIPGQSPFHSPLPSLLRLCNRANNDCKKSEPLLTSSQLQHDESELQSGGTGWSVVPVLNM
jgi:diguanylate cyclase (GGDEF)-like protein